MTRPYYNLSPRLGLVFRPLKGFTFKTFFGQGFLQPPPERKYQQNGTFFSRPGPNGDPEIVAGFWQLPNPDLEPARTNSVEATAQYSKGDFSVSVNGYLNLVGNTWQPVYVNDTTRYVGIPIGQWAYIDNMEELGTFYGGTIFAAYRTVLGAEEQFKIHVNASYSINQGDVPGMTNLPFMAMHNAKMGIFLQYRQLSWYNSLLFRSDSYGQEIADEDGLRLQNQSPAFFLWNSFVRYRLLNKKKIQLSVFAKVQNVLNARYYHAANNSIVGLSAAPQDPIVVVGGVTVHFGRAQRD